MSRDSCGEPVSSMSSSNFTLTATHSPDPYVSSFTGSLAKTTDETVRSYTVQRSGRAVHRCASPRVRQAVEVGVELHVRALGVDSTPGAAVPDAHACAGTFLHLVAEHRIELVGFAHAVGVTLGRTRGTRCQLVMFPLRGVVVVPTPRRPWAPRTRTNSFSVQIPLTISVVC